MPQPAGVSRQCHLSRLAAEGACPARRLPYNLCAPAVDSAPGYKNETLSTVSESSYLVQNLCHHLVRRESWLKALMPPDFFLVGPVEPLPSCRVECRCRRQSEEFDERALK